MKMLLYCYRELPIVSFLGQNKVNLLIGQYEGQQYLFDSLAFVTALCLFIMWVRFKSRDFGDDFRTKLSALKKRLEFSTSQENDRIQLIDKLPKSEQLPSVTDMAQLLVKALPASDRPEAIRLLVRQLLPKKLAGLSTHPNPRRYVDSVYESYIRALQQTRPSQRIQVLRAYLCASEIRQLYRDSLMLAVARYIKEHPDVTNIALNWLGSRDASRWLAMSTIELEDEASQLWKKVERWDELAKTNHPDVWEQEKLKPFSTLLNLESAASGSFDAAMGELGSFLRAVGSSFEDIHLH